MRNWGNKNRIIEDCGKIRENLKNKRPTTRRNRVIVRISSVDTPFREFDVKGQDVALSEYRGKVSLIVNVAGSPRGYNADFNYGELTILHHKYKHKGFEILAFPHNQFGHQEPGSDEEIDRFACTGCKLEYPVFSKVNVNGKDADPLYKFLKARIGEFFGARIKGNFTKFLVNCEGEVVRRFHPTSILLASRRI